MLRIIVRNTASEVGNLVAEYIVKCAREQSFHTLGVATGSSPSAAYRALGRIGSQAVRGLQIFALDEYVGLPYSRSESYYAVVESEIRAPLAMNPARVHVPDGMSSAPNHAASTFEHDIGKAGGIDLQILGIGSNGHIAFNEPGSNWDSRTRVVVLNEQTRAANSRFFPSLDQVPRTAITQGIGTILDAREIVLVADGEEKASAVAKALEGSRDRSVPASVLRNHPNVTFALDKAAASMLTEQSRSEICRDLARA